MAVKTLDKLLYRVQKPPVKLSVWETYNDQIADMRRQGHTLQVIGSTIGVTRERVRQIIKEHYGEIKRNLLTEPNVARIIGCSVTRLQNLRRSGVINPIRYEGFHFYDRSETEKAMLVLQRNCKHCRIPLPIQNISKYCSRCQAEYRRYAYPFLSDEARKKANECSKRWQKEHPEQFRKTSRRAVRKYSEKKRQEHYAKTQYVVVGGEAMPIGSIFKAIRCENSYLVLENGLRISVTNVRKTETEGE